MTLPTDTSQKAIIFLPYYNPALDVLIVERREMS
jgi:hypothetical protein